jgi:hypothetical protein
MTYLEGRATGSHANTSRSHFEEDNVWGWDDPAMNQDDKKYATVMKTSNNLKHSETLPPRR